MKKIAIIGPFPPPIGGISIHIDRVIAVLLKKNIPFVLYNESRSKAPNGRRFYKAFILLNIVRIFITSYKLIHLHTTNPILRLIFGIYGMFGKKVYLHLHGTSLIDTIEKDNLISSLTKKLLKYVYIIADNLELESFVKPYNPKYIFQIDSFLPPAFSKEVLTDFEDMYANKLNDKSFIISMVGWFKTYNDQDLYGFDIAARAIKELSEKDNNVLLLASINGVINEEIYNNFLNYVKEQGIEKNILLIHEDLSEIWALFLYSDVFLRATNTDGSPLSIKEALWFDTPVIASDCIRRPKEITIFKNRDNEDLYKKLELFYDKKNNTFEQKINEYKDKLFKYSLFDEIYKITY
ncbi:MAG: glycosyltransferase family 4 protein [Bacteroidetes bacterium]|nr:glycosyltransferase family 4 protein [Bacteroidota bacterium]